MANNKTLSERIYDSAGTGKADPTELAVLTGLTATTQELNQYTVTVDIANVDTDAAYYVVCPFAGSVDLVYHVLHGAIDTANVSVTARIGSTGMTNGAITVPFSGSAAGQVNSAIPTALNVVTAGQVINFNVSGGGSTGARGSVTAVITR